MLKRILWVVMLLTILILGYWIKCSLGINLIRNFAWEEHFPVLKVFQRPEFVGRPPPGLILSSSFDGLFPLAPWIELWARDPHMATDRIERDDLRGSNCLHVSSRSRRDWALQLASAYQVSPGDEFYYEGYARVAGALEAQLGVVTYDAQKVPLQWFFAGEDVHSPQWTKVERRFTVPEGVMYIRFRLSGKGEGDAYFDDVRFVKEK